ncbi:MAG TPA: NADH-quinone oxidoreductase subunit C [Candidatus Gastranaerophilaceae bacterium]|nr:NADH-quinone oxidoreductase subunit C [Candidatus Gastranaerophilaceae bacterium]HPT42098.1 NADH-quinone oxidoreductase subunit C [Candidatus Gastranaerophilaceae bacterium]
MNFEALQNFDIQVIKQENSFDKIRVDKSNLVDLLSFLKNNAEFDFDTLLSLIAIDLKDSFELIYCVYSTKLNTQRQISVLLDRNLPKVNSIVDVYKSAYFDECEIYDLFGINFENNPDLKRLFMPKGWIGNPLRKDYIADDSRLAWNEVKNA